MRPAFLYGTAWKEDATRDLVTLALAQGFRGIDTANQRKHYFEAAVGEAVQAAIARGEVRREELFLQTKYTFRPGQDERLPYDPDAPIAEQVAQSFRSSLAHLGTDFVDSYVLHGPSRRFGLGAEDWEAWRAMEALHDAGGARALGVSNVDLAQLEALAAEARVQPSFVQNRCFARSGWDYHVRTWCRQHGVVYQGFSLLTANAHVLSALGPIATRYGRTPAQIVFRFAIEVGMLPLTGTSSPEHMAQDLAVLDFALEPDEVARIERIA